MKYLADIKNTGCCTCPKYRIDLNEVGKYCVNLEKLREFAEEDIHAEETV